MDIKYFGWKEGSKNMGMGLSNGAVELTCNLVLSHQMKKRKEMNMEELFFKLLKQNDRNLVNWICDEDYDNQIAFLHLYGKFLSDHANDVPESQVEFYKRLVASVNNEEEELPDDWKKNLNNYWIDKANISERANYANEFLEVYREWTMLR